MPDQRDEFAFASYFQAQYAKATVGIMEGNALDQSLQTVQLRLGRRINELVDMEKVRALSQR
jgi:hypothetical protein